MTTGTHETHHDTARPGPAPETTAEIGRAHV